MQENLGGRKRLSEPPDFGDPLHEEVGFDVKKPIREVDLGGLSLDGPSEVEMGVQAPQQENLRGGGLTSDRGGPP